MTNQNEPKQGKTATIIITFIIGLLIGGGSIWVWLSGQSTDMPTEQKTTEEHEETSALETQNEESTTGQVEVTSTSSNIIVPDQEAGGEVKIQYVTFAEPGWVVIHELLDDNTLGNALGAQRFGAGIASGSVQLLRVTEVGNTYAAVLYRDNGDRRFDLEIDVPVRDANQNVIYTTFSIIK